MHSMLYNIGMYSVLNEIIKIITLLHLRDKCEKRQYMVGPLVQTITTPDDF